MTVRENPGHLAGLYGAEVSPDRRRARGGPGRAEPAARQPASMCCIILGEFGLSALARYGARSASGSLHERLAPHRKNNKGSLLMSLWGTSRGGTFVRATR